MAGRIPQSFINDLLARTDIVEVVDARVALKKAGKDYQARCPFHDEKSPSFTVSPDKQFYYCFGCGASGSALTFLLEHDRLEFVEAVETLARLAGVEVPREGGQPGSEASANKDKEERAVIYELLARAEKLYRQKLKDAPAPVAYLKGRGLTGMVARDFGIGYAPGDWHTVSEAFGAATSGEGGTMERDLLAAGLLTRNDNGRVYDRFRDRIMFPIRDTRGRVIGFGGRVMTSDAGPKYLNSPETPVFHKGRELYGLFEARNALRRIEQLIVVEGYMDVVALSQAGVANAVASLGTAATLEHFRKLYRYAGEVVCCFDGDAAGRRAAWRALENALPTLTDGRQLKFMFLPEGEDPDSLIRQEGKAAFEARLARSSPAIEYLFSELSAGLDLHQLDGQAKLASLVMPHLEAVPAGVLKQLMRNRLEQLTGFSGSGAAASQPSRTGRRAEPMTGLTALNRRLLGHLLRAPWLLLRVSAELKAQVAQAASEAPFAEIVTYIDQNPEVERSELLGRWAGQPLGMALAGLVDDAVPLSDEALVVELEEGLQRYVLERAREARTALLSEIREAPSAAKLEQLRKLQKGRGKAS